MDPEYQGRGIDSARRAFQNQQPELEEDLHLGYTQNPKSMHGGDRYGERPIGNELRRLIRVEHPRAFITRGGGVSSALAIRRAAAVGMWVFARACDRAPRSGPACRTRPVDRFAPNIDEFVADASSRFSLIVDRSRAYLNWRYCDERAGRFVVTIAEDEAGRTLGYCVMKASLGVGHLVDLLVRPDRLDVADTLVADAIAELRTRDVSSVECFLPRKHEYRRVLQRRGFVDVRRPVRLAIANRHGAGDEAALHDPKSELHLVRGDLDDI